MADKFQFVTRYDIFGPPNGCSGQCEGTSYIPVKKDDERPSFRRLWQLSEIVDPTDDGYHFIPCPDCNQKGVKILEEKVEAA